MRASRDAAIDGAFIDFLVNNSNQAVKLCRQLTRGVSPLQDANGDLLEALRRLPNTVPPESGPRLEVEVESQAPLRLSLERSEHLYRMVQEAVTNALKHANAAHIRVRIGVTAETVQVSIEDDGVGMQGRSVPTTALACARWDYAPRPSARPSRCAQDPTAAHSSAASARSRNGSRATKPRSRRKAKPAVDDPAARPALSRESEHASTPATGRAMAGYFGRCLLLASGASRALPSPSLFAGAIDPRARREQLAFGGAIALGGIERGRSDSGRRAPMAGNLLGNAGWRGGAAASDRARMPFTTAADATLAALIILELLSRWRFSRAFDHWQDPMLLFGAAIVGASVIQALDFVGTDDLSMAATRRTGHGGRIALITNAAGATPVVTGAFLSALAVGGRTASPA